MDEGAGPIDGGAGPIDGGAGPIWSDSTVKRVRGVR